MICPYCGQELSEQDRFCYICGAAVETPKKRARLWPAFLALGLIFALGLSAFLLIPPAESPVNENIENETTVAVNPTPWFTIENGVLYFDETLYTGGNELVVPETVNGQKVTAIGDKGFAYCTDLIMIYLPETITTIGDEAFNGCSNLRGIKLPEALTSIGDSAFADCVNLESVCIPYSLKNFGDNLFKNCRKLKYFFYPGPLSDWRELPIGEIPEDSSVYCDGEIHPAT